MKLRHLSARDASQVYDAFQSASVNEAQGRNRHYGFYEYPLSEEDIKERLRLSEKTKLSIGLFDDTARLVAYVLAYPYANGRGLKDSVLQNVNCPNGTIYVDQLFMKPGLPLHIVGRIGDCWTELAQSQNFAGVVCTIPQRPWKNVPSTRLALCRGFNRRGFVSDRDIDLGVFAKPLWKIPGKARDLEIEINK